MYDPRMGTSSTPSDFGRHTGPDIRPRSILGTLRAPVSAATGASLALVVLMLILMTGFVLVLLAGKDVVPYVAFASGPVVASIIGALLAKRAQVIAVDLAQVKHQTNGALAQQFAAAADVRAANEKNRAAAASAIISRIDQMPIVVPPLDIPSSTTQEGTT